jgi:predicted RND superfamily exporter protein
MFRSLNAIQSAIVELGIARPKLVLTGALIVTIVLLVALVLRVTVDTDPENMLSSSHPVRVLNQSIAEEFGAKNMLVLGIVDDEGVLNPGTLANAARLVEDIKALDRVESEGVLSFTSITAVPDGDLSEADVVRIARDIAGDSLLGNRVISEDGMALAI